MSLLIRYLLVCSFALNFSFLPARAASSTQHLYLPFTRVANGQRIVFVRETARNRGDLFAIRVDGTNFQQLTATPQLDEREPAWSPDGTHLAFIRGVPDNPSSYCLCVLNLATAQVITITTSLETARPAQPSWAPDSQQLVFARGGGLYRTNLTGLHLTELTPRLDESSDPAWSPDGRTIAFTALRDTKYQLFLLHLDTATLQPIRPKQTLTGGPFEVTWSPDGTNLAYTQYDGYNSFTSHLCVLALAQLDTPTCFGAYMTRGGSPGSGESSPAWSPDGRLVFAFRQESGSVHFDYPPYLYSALPNGTDRRQVTDQAGYSPTWSPD